MKHKFLTLALSMLPILCNPYSQKTKYSDLTNRNIENREVSISITTKNNERYLTDEEQIDKILLEFDKKYSYLYNTKIINPNTSEKNNIAIIINDMQREFLIQHSPKEIIKEIPNYVKVLEFAKNNNIPVIEIEYAADSNTGTITVLKKIINSLPIKKSINKNSDDGFENTTLENALNNYGAKYILFTGINESACMYETGKTAVKKGFKLLVSHDLTSNPKLAEHIYPVDAPYYPADPEQYKEMYNKYSIYRLTKNGGKHADDYRELLKFIENISSKQK